MNSLMDWAAIERRWLEQWNRYAVGHVCSSCGAPADGAPLDTGWRWTGKGYEHKCPGNDGNAGYFPAVKREARP